MTPDESEQQAWDPDVRDVYLKDRRRAACGHASDTIELAVKTVIALSGFPPSRTHNLRVLLGEVRSEAWRRELTEIVGASGLVVKDVLAWHALSAYTTDEGKQWRKAEADLTAMVQLAHDAALYADGVFMAEGGDPAPSRMVTSKSPGCGDSPGVHRRGQPGAVRASTKDSKTASAMAAISVSVRVLDGVLGEHRGHLESERLGLGRGR